MELFFYKRYDKEKTSVFESRVIVFSMIDLVKGILGEQQYKTRTSWATLALA